MPMPTLPSERPPRQIRGLAPVSSVDGLALPVRQEMTIPFETAEVLRSAAARALSAGGFEVVDARASGRVRKAATLAAETPGQIYAERNVRRAPTHASMRLAIVVIVGAGVALGALDALLVGTVVYGFIWVAAAVLVAGVLWVRYGRTFVSEVAEVRLAGPGGSMPTGPTGRVGSSRVVLSGGRIRSIFFDGRRTAVSVVDCPVPLMEALAAVAHRFEEELGRREVAVSAGGSFTGRAGAAP